MPIQTLAIRGATPKPLLYQGDVMGQCPIRASIEIVMPIQTLAIRGATPKPLLYQGVVMEHRPIQIVDLTVKKLFVSLPRVGAK